MLHAKTVLWFDFLRHFNNYLINLNGRVEQSDVSRLTIGLAHGYGVGLSAGGVDPSTPHHQEQPRKCSGFADEWGR